MDISRAGTEPVVVKFYRQYMQQISDVTYPPGGLLVNPDVQDCLYKYFFDAVQNKFLPPARYQAKILKHIIGEIEKSCRNEEDQVSDRLMEHMAHLATIPRRHPSDEAQELCVHCYFPPLALDAAGLKPILVNEARNLLSRGNNVGLRTWEAALHLAWYLMTVHRPGLVRGRNVLELGAGTGFLSLLCAGQLEAGHVLATDGLGHVCESMQANFDLNENEHQGTLRGRPPPQARQLDWTDPSEIDRLLAGDVQYDLVIGADITYHPDILRPLAELLSRLKDKFPNVVIIISATIRSDTFAQFVAICRDLGFQVKELNCDIPDGLRYSGFFHSVATEIKIVSLER